MSRMTIERVCTAVTRFETESCQECGEVILGPPRRAVAHRQEESAGLSGVSGSRFRIHRNIVEGGQGRGQDDEVRPVVTFLSGNRRAFRLVALVQASGSACDEWYSGAYLLETVPSVLYILMRQGADPEEAIVRAVNDTQDNDTIAAIVGAAVGALQGAAALPARWVEGLPGRTRR
jgi:hypothetical protein